MADLQTIYKEFGIQGIVPYAFQRGGEAYQFLARKMKEEASLYLITSKVTAVPYLDVFHLGAYAMICLSQEQANAICDKLARSGAQAYYDRLVTNEEKEKKLQHIRDIGAVGVQIDNDLMVYIQDLVATPDYDGFKSPDVPLRNSTMNAALYILCQKAAAGHNNQNLLQYLFRRIQTGHFLVPIAIADSAEGTLGKDDFIVPTMLSEDGYSLVAIFTDTASFQDACESDEKIRRLFPQQLTYVAEYQFLIELLTGQEKMAVVINPGTANLNIDGGSLISLEAEFVASEATQGNNCADEDDPVPDFLK